MTTRMRERPACAAVDDDLVLDCCMRLDRAWHRSVRSVAVVDVADVADDDGVVVVDGGCGDCGGGDDG